MFELIRKYQIKHIENYAYFCNFIPFRWKEMNSHEVYSAHVNQINKQMLYIKCSQIQKNKCRWQGFLLNGTCCVTESSLCLLVKKQYTGACCESVRCRCVCGVFFPEMLNMYARNCRQLHVWGAVKRWPIFKPIFDYLVLLKLDPKRAVPCLDL